MNWFSYDYWWFVWLMFIGAIALFLYLCSDQKSTGSCNVEYLHEGLERIETGLIDCCNCDEEVVYEMEETIQDSISSTYGCDSEARSGGAGITTNKHTLGNRPGVVSITFDMENVVDKLEVFHNGQLMTSTFDVPNNDNGFVGNNIASGCCGTLSFNYSAAGDDFCIVKVTGKDQTSWTYSLSCPQ